MKGRLLSRYCESTMDGKEFEIKGIVNDESGLYYLQDKSGILYKVHTSHVELTDTDFTDWNNVRIKAAMNAMSDITKNRRLYNQVISECQVNDNKHISECVATAAVEFADALVEKLKNNVMK